MLCSLGGFALQFPENLIAITALATYAACHSKM